MVFDHLPAIARPARPTAAAACGRRIGIGAKGHVVGAGRQGQIIGDGLIEEQAVVVGLKYGFVHSFSFKWGLHCKCARWLRSNSSSSEPPPRQPRGRCGLWIFERWPEFLCAVRRRCYRPGRRSQDAGGKRHTTLGSMRRLPHCKCEGLAAAGVQREQERYGHAGSRRRSTDCQEPSRIAFMSAVRILDNSGATLSMTVARDRGEHGVPPRIHV